MVASHTASSIPAQVPCPSHGGRPAFALQYLNSENRGRGRQNENLKPHRQSPKVTGASAGSLLPTATRRLPGNMVVCLH
jgi:hypothetical protein